MFLRKVTYMIFSLVLNLLPGFGRLAVYLVFVWNSSVLAAGAHAPGNGEWQRAGQRVVAAAERLSCADCASLIRCIHCPGNVKQQYCKQG